MLGDPLLRDRFRRRTEALAAVAERKARDERGTPFGPAFAHAAGRLRAVLAAWDRLGGDLVGLVRRLRDSGVVEVATTAATHALLPLLVSRPAAVRAQVRTARRAFRAAFGADPVGFWLPECGWAPEADALLAAEGVRFTFLETHGLLHGRPRPRAGVHAPARTPAGLAVLGRDPVAARRVWSRVDGYPGDAAYREFHRDVGYDAPAEDLAGLLPGDGARAPVGLKVHRITGRVPLGEKEPYVPAVAERKAREDAASLVATLGRRAAEAAAALGRPAWIVAPYDAELFGHWWYEGPLFLEEVLRRVATGEGGLEAVAPPEALEADPPGETVEPAFSTWGDGGYAGVWLNPRNDWIAPAVLDVTDRMVALASARPDSGALPPPLGRALDQAAREVLLAQASDWPFLVSAGTAAHYAARRVRDHLEAFGRLEAMIRRGAVDEGDLAEREARNALFPAGIIDYRDFGPMD